MGCGVALSRHLLAVRIAASSGQTQSIIRNRNYETWYLATGTHKVLVRGGSHAHYVPSGHLVYAAAGTLRAIGFDLARLETDGTPVPVIPQVATISTGAVEAVVAGNGTLAYIPGGVAVGAQRTLVWVDRQGQETPIAAPPRAYHYPRIAPDGTRVALYRIDQENDIWLWDLARQTLTRVTFDAAADSYPVWTPDGRRLLFSSERAGPRNLFGQAADGTGAVERRPRVRTCRMRRRSRPTARGCSSGRRHRKPAAT